MLNKTQIRILPFVFGFLYFIKMGKFISDCIDGRSAAVRFKELFFTRLNESDFNGKFCVGVEDLVDAFTLGFNMGINNRFPSSINRTGNFNQSRALFNKVSDSVKKDVSQLSIDLSSLDGFIKHFECSPYKYQDQNFEILVRAKVLYLEYVKYCKNNSAGYLSLVKFGEFMTKSGFVKKRVSQGIRYSIYVSPKSYVSIYETIIE